MSDDNEGTIRTQDLRGPAFSIPLFRELARRYNDPFVKRFGKKGGRVLHLTPFLLFDGNCAEAMEFYTACFGGELTLTRLADTPMKESFPIGQHQKITYAILKSAAVEFSATDWLHPTRKPTQGNTTAMFITGADPAELRTIFNKLSDGANREFFVELREMPFGLYGRLTDRYGVEWFFRGQ